MNSSPRALDSPTQDSPMAYPITHSPLPVPYKTDLLARFRALNLTAQTAFSVAHAESADRASRRSFCWAFAVFTPVDGDLDFPSSIDWCEDVQLALKLEGERLLKTLGPLRAARAANLLVFTSHPPCFWCLSTKENINKSEMIRCECCRIAAYCSEEHRRKAAMSHAEVHTTMGQTECDCLALTGSSSVRSQREEFLTWNTHTSLQSFPDEFSSETWSSFLSPTGQSYTLTPSLMRAVIATAYSFTFTILDAIRRFQIPSLSIDEMIIDFLEFENSDVGPEELFLFEEIIHQIPNLTTLVVKFIGPTRVMRIEGTTCLPCQKLDRQMIIHEHINTNYLAYADHETYVKPTLVVALHQNPKHLTDEWASVVKYLLVQNTPLLVTSYNQSDADAVAERLRVLGAHTAWQDNRNPWSGLSVFSDELMHEHTRHDNAHTIGVRGFQGPL